MLQYLVILLDDTSISYCHYANNIQNKHLVELETLRKGILFGIKENLNIQIVYPPYLIPDEYNRVIDSADCVKIKPFNIANEANAVVFDNIIETKGFKFEKTVDYILRIDKRSLFAKYKDVGQILTLVRRLNICLTDIESFSPIDFMSYEKVLAHLSDNLEQLYFQGITPQCNVITDRIMLSKMNNCGAGDVSVTLAPNGKFYICPAFYIHDSKSEIGDLEHEIKIKNKQLYQIDHAPICLHCDAYQCHRCIWCNKRTTLEVNTPSHEQCVISHLERNASRTFKQTITKFSSIFSQYEDITELKYLDPFENIKEWKEN